MLRGVRQEVRRSAQSAPPRGEVPLGDGLRVRAVREALLHPQEPQLPHEVAQSGPPVQVSPRRLRAALHQPATPHVPRGHPLGHQRQEERALRLLRKE